MRRILALLLGMCLLLCGCTETPDAYVPTGNGLSYDSDYTGPQNTLPPEEKAQTLSLVYYKEENFNPYSSGDFTNRALFSLLYQGLFTVDRDYVTEPMLCKSFTMTKDMKTYTFYLEKATFSDGSLLTAEDVVASLTAARGNRYYAGRFTHIKEIKKSTDGGVTVQLDTPYENLPILLDIPIVKAAYVGADRPLGTGPYVIYSAAGGESLHRRTNWWCRPDMAVTAETITLFPAESNTQIRDQFEFFDLSLVCADPGSDRYVDYRCDYELWDCENGIFLYLSTTANSEVFSIDSVRTALTYAIDRDTLVANYYRGFARSVTLPASPQSPYYNIALAERYKYNKERFAEAVRNAGMVDAKVVFLVNSDDSLRLRLARDIKKMLEDCGLVVEMSLLGGHEYVDALKTWKFDIHLGQTRLSPNMDLSPFFDTYGELSWGGVNDVVAYSLCLQALENHGNYYTLYDTVMKNGLLCPILVRSYAVYATRGLLTELTPARDNVFYYSLGKSTEAIKTVVENVPVPEPTE